MDVIPETGFVRLSQVLSVIPLGKTCWWKGVKSGRFPKPIKLSDVNGDRIVQRSAVE
jgi:predicted DNA-binding transcriptional regulator AlpA